jgi:hypothetical protein
MWSWGEGKTGEVKCTYEMLPYAVIYYLLTIYNITKSLFCSLRSIVGVYKLNTLASTQAMPAYIITPWLEPLQRPTIL